MQAFRGIGLILLFAIVATPAVARKWTVRESGGSIEADLVSVKNGKVYLEKQDGTVLAILLPKLSVADIEHLRSFPEHAGEMHKVKLPKSEGNAESTGAGSTKPATQMATIHVDDETQVGEIRRFKDLRWGVRSLAFSPNGGLLAAGKSDRALIIFDVDKSKPTSVHQDLQGLDTISCVRFTPDGKQLLTGGRRGRIQIWNVDPAGKLTEAGRFVGHSDEIKSITISADGKYVLSGGDDKMLRYWNVNDAREIFAFDGFKGRVKATFISHSGKQGLGCDGQTLALVNLETGQALQSMKLASYTAQAAAIAPDGSRVVVTDSYALRMWDIRSGKEYPKLQDRETQWSARFSPDSKYVISGGRGVVNLWEVETQRKLHEFDTSTIFYVQCLAYSPDGRHISSVPSASGQDVQVFRLPIDVAK